MMKRISSAVVHRGYRRLIPQGNVRRNVISGPQHLRMAAGAHDPMGVFPNRSFVSNKSKAYDNIVEAEFVEKEPKPAPKKYMGDFVDLGHAVEEPTEAVAPTKKKKAKKETIVEEEPSKEPKLPEEFDYLKDWLTLKDTTFYGKIIDVARLTAEFAYERNGAVVGALAEAGGDEGAAERWVLGVWKLFLHTLQPVWFDQEDEMSEQIDQHHQEALLKLALNKAGNHYIRKCVDPKKLKDEMDLKDYEQLENLSQELVMILLAGTEEIEELVDEAQADNQEEGHPDGPIVWAFPPKAIAQAKQIWGEEAILEIKKMTPQQREDEAYGELLDQQGILKKVKPEEGHWWGPATHEDPHELYHRLIDAARYGTMKAYEGGEYIGSIADAMNEVEPDELEDGDPPEKQEGDSRYEPKKLGPNTVAHFEEFLSDLKGENNDKFELIPEWWNEEHEAAVWELGKGMDGIHTLAYPLDKDDIQDLYPDEGVRTKVTLLADAAKELSAAEDNYYDDIDYDKKTKDLMAMEGEGEEEDEGIEYEVESEDDSDSEEEEAKGKMEEYYSKMTLPELKDRLRVQGLKVGGRKAELIARLQENEK